MKYKNSITPLVICIVAFAAIAAVCGIFTFKGIESFTFENVFGRNVTIYGKGIYASNSVLTALKAKAQDLMVLGLGIPLLIYSLLRARKKYIIGRLILAGTLGYFLITYSDKTFHIMYNRLFLTYVVVLSASAFAFVLSLKNFDLKKTNVYFKRHFPVTWVGMFLFLYALSIAATELLIVIPSTIRGTVPHQMEHGATMVMVAIHLAFLVPSLVFAGTQVITKRSVGYIMAAVLSFTSLLLLATNLAQNLLLTYMGYQVIIPLLLAAILFVLSVITIFRIFHYVAELKRTEEREAKSD